MSVVTIEFESYERSITEALDALDASAQIAGQSAILIKPNLVNDSPPPITTPYEACEAIIRYISNHSNADIVIAEGCGSATLETPEVFRRLGYTAMAERLGVPLIDLNYGPVRKLTNPDCTVFPEMYLPEIAFNHYIVSVPMLKRHSLATVTGTLKNMIGFAQPEYYTGQYGIWKKAVFHGRMQDSIIDLNRYLVPDLSIMDCSVGMAEHHLRGSQCDPPVNKIIAGYDPWAVDREAAGLLGLDPDGIAHIAAGLVRN
jgi:uncharacterized protein (DUF362 family)